VKTSLVYTVERIYGLVEKAGARSEGVKEWWVVRVEEDEVAGTGKGESEFARWCKVDGEAMFTREQQERSSCCGCSLCIQLFAGVISL